MKRLIFRISALYCVLTGFESLAGAIYLLVIPSDVKNSSLLGLVYSLPRMILIGFFLAGFLFLIIYAYINWNGSTRLNNSLNLLLTDETLLWEWFRAIFTLSLIFIAICLLDPKIFGVLRYFYLRLEPVFLWAALATLQAALGLVLIHYAENRSLPAIGRGLKYVLGFGKLSTSADHGVFSLCYEIVGLLALFFGCWWVLFIHAGGPQSWDEMLYMNLSLHPEPAPYVLNRYVHIYLQKVFFTLAGNDPFVGARLFWSFLIAGTIVLITFNATRFTRNKNYLFGMMAVLFFLMQPRILPFAGVTYADYTAMFMVTLALTFYLLFFRSKKFTSIWLILMGLAIFCAYKSTDTGIFSCVFLAGLGYSKNDDFDFGFLIRNLLFVICGIVIGQMVLCFLDKIIIGDPFFSLRLSSWQSVFSYNAVFTGGYRNATMIAVILSAVTGGVVILWYCLRRRENRRFTLHLLGKDIPLTIDQGIVGFFKVTIIVGIILLLPYRGWDYLLSNGRQYIEYLFRIMWLPLLLYVVTFYKKRNEPLIGYQKVVWLYPLLLFLFLISFSIFSSRYHFPALPVICILAVQWFDSISTKGALVGWQKIAILLLFPMDLAYLIYNGPSMDTLGTFTIFLGILLIFIVFFVRNPRSFYTGIAFICVLLIIIPTIAYYSIPFLNGNQVRLFERRFAPLEITAPYVSCNSNPKVYASGNIFREYGVLSRDESSLLWMFNIYYRCNLDDSKFTQPGLQASAETPRQPLDEDTLLGGGYTYIYMTDMDWDSLSTSTRYGLESRYKVEKVKWRPDVATTDFQVRQSENSTPLHFGKLSRLSTNINKTVELYQVNAPVSIVFLHP